jgi:hypothetical protein
VFSEFNKIVTIKGMQFGKFGKFGNFENTSEINP